MQQSDSFQLAGDFVNHTNVSIFLTGNAGTGKTTFLKYCKEHSIKNTAIVAPTGVAAINAGGTTIHSFFQLPFTPFIPVARHFMEADGVNDKNSLINRLKLTSDRREVMRNLELLIIDEISMVRSDVLDAIDIVLRHVRNRHTHAFGGVQILFIGDMYQLPPVVKEEEWLVLSDYYTSQFFFNSKVLEAHPPVQIKLEKIYRQNDPAFVKILNQVRNNEMDTEGFERLHSRFLPEEMPSKEENYITLTTHNHKAEAINRTALDEIREKEMLFEAEVAGEFFEKSYPAEAQLKLKVGAQVMFIKNDIEKVKRYFNGKIGIIDSIEEDKIMVRCKGEEWPIEVIKEKWKNIQYTVDKESNKVEEKEIGSFTQFPLRLAWAITIHKSQGLTFEKAVIDAGDAFAAGQVYVALSRCTTLDGIILKSRIKRSSLTADARIAAFSEQQNYTGSALLEKAKAEYQYVKIKEVFDLSRLVQLAKEVVNFAEKEKDGFITPCKIILENLRDNIKKEDQIAKKFERQLDELMNQSTSDQDEMLQSRIIAASKHFLAFIEKIKWSLEKIKAETDSLLLAKDLYKQLQVLYDEICIKQHQLIGCENGFNLEMFIQHSRRFKKSILAIQIYSGVTEQSNATMEFPELYRQLKQKRNELCSERNLPVYLVANAASIEEMCLYLPRTIEDLNKIKGFGPVKSRQYGKFFLEIIEQYCEENNIISPKKTIKPKKEKEKKADKKKADTKELSYQLFKMGKSVEEIALERQLAKSTIEGHLLHYIQVGQIALKELMTAKKITIIQNAIKQIESNDFKLLKEHLGEEISYMEIRMVVGST